MASTLTRNRIPLIWGGRPVLVIGSGPSLRPEDIEAAKAAGLPTIGCNDNFVFNPDVLYVADPPWVDANLECQSHPDKWTVSESIAEKYPDAGWNCIQVEVTGGKAGLSFDPYMVHHGFNAGYQMLNWAMLAGAKKIILTGYDMQPDGERMRWRGRHPGGVEKGGAEKFAKWRAKFATTVPDLASAGVEVINCTRSTALECFPVAALSDTLAACGNDSI